MKKPQLFLLHFAGGNCYSFQFLVSSLRDFEIISLELPGRGKRVDEELLTDFDLAATDIYLQIKNKLTVDNFLIYGHSMGAYLALKVSDMLEQDGKKPGYVFVSGNAGPGIMKDKKTYQLQHDDFVAELRDLGGIPEEIIENEELFNFFEPVLRADFEIAEENKINTESLISSPIYAMMGNKEKKVAQISNWGLFTRSYFNYEIMEGNHFFIYDHPGKIASIIKECYNRIKSYSV